MSVSIQPTVSQADYAALHTGALLQTRPTHGLLQVSDKDRADFLHRMSTNNINAMHPGQAAVTILTSPTARNLFAFTVVAQEDVLLLLPAAARTAALARHLRGQIFFMDAVVVRDQSEEYARLRIMGPKSAAVVAALGITFDLGDDATIDAITGTWRAADGILAVAQTDFDVPGIELVVPLDQLDQTIATLAAAGAVPAESDDAYTARRVELGRPLPGYEVIDAFNPLEVGLGWSCAENKGCYTGQEIIARQVTYDKVTKTLVGLRSQHPLARGAAVQQEGRTVGTITSAAFSPTLGEHIALAVLKRPENTPGTMVDVEGAAAVVSALPLVA